VLVWFVHAFITMVVSTDGLEGCLMVGSVVCDVGFK
jgi:hypothetical protein